MATFTEVHAKSLDPAFRAKLVIAVTEQCRFTLTRAINGGESTNHYDWAKTTARNLLQEIMHEAHVTRIARLCLLPAAWTGFNPDLDADLQNRVGTPSYFALFTATPEPA